MPTSSQPTTKLQTFIRAQETLYGPITTIRDATKWTPPGNSGGHRGRYLWTDAFGVLNFLTLHHEHNRLMSTSTSTSSPRMHPQSQPQRNNHYLTLATALIRTVHNTLGTTRTSNPENPTLLPKATPTNPLGGGLRIGKPSATGPDGDGQYHHYLTLWMFALNRTAVATGEAIWNEQAIALAKAIHPRFLVQRTPPRMVWKMDVDLEEVLVGSEGNLDSVDGLVVFRLLQRTARWFGRRQGQGCRGEGEEKEQEKKEEEDDGPLTEEIEDYRRILKRKGEEQYVSYDPLDLGMAMWTAHWFADTKGEEWATRMAEVCLGRVDDLFERRNYLARDIRARLAFREFGTCLGLRCMAEQSSDKDRAGDLKLYADRLLGCWEPYIWLSAGRNATPEDLQPITRVMYAAALIPGAFCRGYFGSEPAV